MEAAVVLLLLLLLLLLVVLFVNRLVSNGRPLVGKVLPPAADQKFDFACGIEEEDEDDLPLLLSGLVAKSRGASTCKTFWCWDEELCEVLGEETAEE